MARKLDRINRFLEGVDHNIRELATPEGVTLEVDVANHGERLTAFVLDFFFWMLATVLLYVVMGLLLAHSFRTFGFDEDGVSFEITLLLFLSFLLRNLYFIHFELTTQGSTPGKRIVGLKVIDRKGGPLLPSAIVARNLTRELEVFLPLGLYLQLVGGAGGWMGLAYFAWIALLSGLPFFNRDHLRAGDLIAGTLVISLPRRVLLPELAEAQDKFKFSTRQLEVYGAFELQVLEEVLRRKPSQDTQRIWQEICNKICVRIGWTDPLPSESAHDFLKAFYTAERAFLEREQLFGKYRADKTGAATPS